MNTHRKVVIVTGSSGLIGSAVVRRLAEQYRVVGFDRAGDPHPPTEAECVCVDVTSEESVRAGLSRVRDAYGERIASVVHLAAYYDFSGEPSPKYEEVTVHGTERLLRRLQDFRVEQFVFSSTMLVHAPSEPRRPITEDSPLAPTWEYPHSKAETERLILAERGDIPFVLLRIAGVYDERGHSIPIAHQIQRIYERQLTSHVFPGDPARGRQSFVHLDDLVTAFGLLAQHRAELPPELTLLIGEPEAMSYGELQYALGCAIHGEEWATRQVPERLAEAGAWVQDKFPAGRESFISHGWSSSRTTTTCSTSPARARYSAGSPAIGCAKSCRRWSRGSKPIRSAGTARTSLSPPDGSMRQVRRPLRRSRLTRLRSRPGNERYRRDECIPSTASIARTPAGGATRMERWLHAGADVQRWATWTWAASAAG